MWTVLPICYQGYSQLCRYSTSCWAFIQFNRVRWVAWRRVLGLSEIFLSAFLQPLTNLSVATATSDFHICPLQTRPWRCSSQVRSSKDVLGLVFLAWYGSFLSALIVAYETTTEVGWSSCKPSKKHRSLTSNGPDMDLLKLITSEPSKGEVHNADLVSRERLISPCDFNWTFSVKPLNWSFCLRNATAPALGLIAGGFLIL